jgi:hypothetical protein
LWRAIFGVVAVQITMVTSALPLLVARVGADHHDAAVPADDLAVFTDCFDAGTNFHGDTFLRGSVGANPRQSAMGRLSMVLRASG